MKKKITMLFLSFFMISSFIALETMASNTTNKSLLAYDVTFNVTDGTNPLAGVDIMIENVNTLTTDGTGSVLFSAVDEGTYNYTAIKAGYIPEQGVLIIAGANEIVNLALDVEPAPTVIFSDDFESGSTNWVFVSNLGTQNWGLVTNASHSPTHSMTESPVGNYKDEMTSTATMAAGVDLTSAMSATVTFWAKYLLESGFDYMYLEASSDDFAHVSLLNTFNGQAAANNTWTEYSYSLGAFTGQSNVKIRFRFVSDEGYNLAGMNVDDFTISTRQVDDAAPYVDHAGPVHYQGSLGDHVVTADLIDQSGINVADLYYYVDDVLVVDPIHGINTTGNTYTFTIPVQTPGTSVKYFIYAQDFAPYRNEVTTADYEYIAGNYIAYDNGITDFINSFGPASSAGLEGCATRITLAGTDLVYMLLRNYTDATNVNSPMLVHIWNDNAGVPGTDVITPFSVTPEATTTNTSPMTRIDLRPYAAQLTNLTGDYYIGFTVPTGQTWITQSTPAIANRSFSYDGSAWTLETDDWHFRAITSAMADINGPLIANNSPVENLYATTQNQTINATITDISGVDLTSVQLNYTVDGVAQTPIMGVNTVGNTFTFEIPGQNQGTIVTYQIEAADLTTPTANTSLSSVTKYITGEQVFYYNDETTDPASTFFSTFGPAGSSGANGVAVKINIPVGYSANLTTLLIRSYWDNTLGYDNDDLEIHIWANNAGLPGADLITPFTVPSAANATAIYRQWTVADLRPYSAQLNGLSGEVFVGAMVPTGQSNLMVTTNGVDDFGFSFITDGTDWYAQADATDTSDYHVRAIVDFYNKTNDIVSNNEINVYPNPARDFVRINSSEEITSVKISDLLGKTIRTMSLNTNSAIINTNNLNSGLYILQVETKSGIKTQKFQIK